MGIGIESLFTANAPKSVNYIRQGGNPEYTREEKLFILSQVQRQQPLGSAILTAQIAQCRTARARVVGELQAWLVSTGLLSEDAAYTIADCATAEVCDSPACKHCGGTGNIVSTEQLKIVECKHCHGYGRKIVNKEDLHRAIAPKIHYQTFIKRFYDIYMNAVDVLHKEASKAAGCAKYLTDSAS